MSRFRFSAAGAAALVVTLLGFHAAPSRALELNLPPVTSQLVEAAAPAPVPTEASLPQVEPTSQPEAQLVPLSSPLPAPEPAPERRSLAAMVSDYASSTPRTSEEECLAGAIYFEAKGEPLNGQLSVAEVILNRAKSGRFPKSACGVVKQRGQFSFVRGGRIPAAPRASGAWKHAVAIARVAIEDRIDSPAAKALFFHAKRVRPAWRGVTRVASVGNHVFYR
jgi:spore germination cell wall hydrolase CwlJ-like protein